jgi:ATP-binding cassette subfamily B protein
MSVKDIEQEKHYASTVVRFYWRHAKRYKGLIAGLAIVLPLTILINRYLPSLILADVLSRLGQHNFVAGQIWQSFGTQIVSYAVLLLIGIGAWRLVDVFVWRLEQNIQRDIAQELFAHMLGRSADFHANHFSGSLVSKSNKLIAGYVRMADTTIFQTAPLVSGMVFAIIILAPRAPMFALALGVFSGLYIVGSIFASRKVRRLSGTYASYESRQTGYLADAITNVMAIKSFARTTYEEKRFARATEETRRHLKRFARAHQLQMNTLGLMGRTISAGSLLIAVIAVMMFDANIATVFLIFNYTAMTVDQLFDFSNSGLRNYSRAVGDASEITATLGQQPEVRDPESPEVPRIHKGVIEFQDVTFAHAGADGAIFSGLNLHIKPGEKIGLVGHSGSGKSTFTRLLLRFSDIDDGQILIDGQNIASLRQDDLHEHIAYVPQEPLLFHRTIRENIAYGKSDASDREVREAAEKAHAMEFIDKLPKGFETLVGERGVKLSGGQRQRIAIARAILKDAPILVLDEATSALDSESEKLIQAALWELMEGRTAIVIAHRLSTIQRMDRIVVLNDGNIIEQGAHAQLLKNNGIYAKLWAHQSGGFIEE